jgi:hypothetical protein
VIQRWIGGPPLGASRSAAQAASTEGGEPDSQDANSLHPVDLSIRSTGIRRGSARPRRSLSDRGLSRSLVTTRAPFLASAPQPAVPRQPGEASVALTDKTAWVGDGRRADVSEAIFTFLGSCRRSDDAERTDGERERDPTYDSRSQSLLLSRWKNAATAVLPTVCQSLATRSASCAGVVPRSSSGMPGRGTPVSADGTTTTETGPQVRPWRRDQRFG